MTEEQKKKRKKEKKQICAFVYLVDILWYPCLSHDNFLVFLYWVGERESKK